MRLLITRPEPDATALKAHLLAEGHDVLIEPLLTIAFEDADPIELDGVQALIATSRNGVRALAASPAFDDAQALPLYAVGPGTAATAKALGLSYVIEGPRAARDLVTLIALHAEVNGGPLLYLAGDTLAADLPGELRRLGFHVLEPVVYATRYATTLSPTIVARFQAREIGGVLLLSPRTARTYAGLIARHGLIEKSRAALHLCISAAAARELAALAPARIATAKAPNLQEMLALVARNAPQSH